MSGQAAKNPFQGAAARAFQKNQIPVPHIIVNGGPQLIHAACMERTPRLKPFAGGGRFFPVEEHHVRPAVRQKPPHAFVGLF